MSFYKPPPGAFSLTSGLKVQSSSNLNSSKDGTEESVTKPKPVVPPKPQSLVVGTPGQVDDSKSKPLPQPPKPTKASDPVENSNATSASTAQLPAKPPKPPKAQRLSRVLNPAEAVGVRESLQSALQQQQQTTPPPIQERTASLRNLPIPDQTKKQNTPTAPAPVPAPTPSQPNESLQQLAALQRENEELKTINILLDKREKGLLETQQINKNQIELQRNEIERLKSVATDYEQQVNSLNTINKHLTDATEKQKTIISSLQNEISDLTKQLTRHQLQQQEMERLKQQLTANQKETQSFYEEAIKKLQQQLEEHEKLLAAEKKKTQLLQQLNADLEDKLKIEREMAVQKAEIKVMQQQAEAKKQQEQKLVLQETPIVIEEVPIVAPEPIQPQQTVPQESAVKWVKVVFAYEAKDTDELNLEVGEMIRVISYDPETGWSEGVNSKGASGLFPNNFVLIVTQQEAKQAPPSQTQPQQAPQPTQSSQPETSKIVKADQPVIIKVIALYAYNKTEEDELTFERGDIIEVIQRDDDSGWWFGRLQKNGLEGLFPDNYVKEVK